MPNATAQIINPAVDWSQVIKNTLFSGRYITNSLVNLLLKFGVPLSQEQISRIGIVIFLIAIYAIMEFAQKLKPIVKILIVVVLGWVMLGFFV